MSVYNEFTAHHALWSFGLAAAASLLASLTTFRLLAFARQMKEWRRLGWVLLAAFACGAGIWSTHFVTMLGYRPDSPIGFDLAPTVLSLVIVVAAAFPPLAICRSERRLPRLLAAGAMLGLGIAALHYLGMQGVRLPGQIAWHPGLVALSVALGVTFSCLAVVVFAREGLRFPVTAPMALLSVGTLSVHFTAMAALDVVPGPAGAEVQGDLPRFALALGVSAALSVVLGLAGLSLQAERLRRAFATLHLRDRQLRARTEQFDAALNHMSQGLAMYDSENRLIVSNRRYCELTGIAPEFMQPGRKFREVLEANKALGNFPDKSLEQVWQERLALIAARKPAAFTQTHSSGRIIAVHFEPATSGGWVATYEDVTAQKHAEAQIRHMAHHDALTGLPNRARFFDELKEALAGVSSERTIAIFFLDLDRFKEVNDTLGHPVGDELLKAVSGRLRRSVRAPDCVARLGGDEFAVLQTGFSRVDDVALLADRMIETISAPFDLGGNRVMLGASIGITLAPQHGSCPGELLRNADLALYRSKAEGCGTPHFFTPDMVAEVERRRSVDLDMRTALERDEFELFYQPIVDLGRDTVSGFEALLRWRRADGGLMLPDSFIPLAEETGFIEAVGRWVLREACRTAATWPSGVRVSVNLSARQFVSGQLVREVAEALREGNLPPERLEVEITETVLIEKTDASLATLRGLRDLGVGIALDDFGTGYASLGYLRKFPFDRLKIDRSFMAGLPHDPDSLSIVEAVAGLGASLNIHTVAEGVEHPDQLLPLRAQGCDEAQGYYFSHPRPAGEVDAMIDGATARLRQLAAPLGEQRSSRRA